MIKAIFFVAGCGGLTLAAGLLILAVSGSSVQELQRQMALSPATTWTLAGMGIASGTIVATANTLGPWPQLPWRKVALAYTLCPAALALLLLTVLAPLRSATTSSSVSRFTYVTLDPGMAWLYLIPTTALAAWVALRRRQPQARTPER